MKPKNIYFIIPILLVLLHLYNWIYIYYSSYQFFIPILFYLLVYNLFLYNRNFFEKIFFLVTFILFRDWLFITPYHYAINIFGYFLSDLSYILIIPGFVATGVTYLAQRILYDKNMPMSIKNTLLLLFVFSVSLFIAVIIMVLLEISGMGE